MPGHQSKVAALAVTLALCSAANATTAEPPSFDAIKKCIVEEASKADFSGVVSFKRGGDAFSHARGIMAETGSVTIPPDAQFNLGSAGKMFTAVAVAQLIDAKKIALDDPIGRHVSGLTAEAAVVTIRQLLTHSSGLGNFFTPDTLPLLQKAKSLSELKPLVVADKPAFKPGSRFQYSNSGFLLLGLMVEKVSGKPFAEYLKLRVFRPSGMISTDLVPGTNPMRAVGMTMMPEMPALPPGGMTGPGTAPIGPPPDPPPGAGPGAPNGPFLPPAGPLRPAAEAALRGNSAGGSYSNAADMHRFFAALLAGKLTSITMRDLLISPQIEVAPAKDGKPARAYGFGFGIGTYNGHRWAGHNGGTLGVNVELTAFPDDQVTIAILSNRDPPTAGALMRKVQSIMIDGALCDQTAR